mmetsp:Transcript_10351/g.24495  ORF Transcript_10351/g.24495 Transcript_10351/m.24495 type:complete len:210 (-) Transcript_10351:299-928(-)
MVLDTEPMYCAEQITIPENLGEILKAYAKEVIRQQPQNIFEFSARYFAQLDQQEDQYLDGGTEELQRDHVVRLVMECKDQLKEDVELAKLRELCEVAGVPAAIVNETLELIFTEEEGVVQWKHFAVALCARVASVEDVSGFVRLLLDPGMFGNDEGMLHKAEFMTLFDWWSSVDSAITAETKSALFATLDDGDDMVSYQTFYDALKGAE